VLTRGFSVTQAHAGMGNELSCCETPGGRDVQQAARGAYVSTDGRQATASRGEGPTLLAQRLLAEPLERPDQRNAVMTRLDTHGGHSGARGSARPGSNGPESGSSGSRMSWKQKPLGSYYTSRRFQSKEDELHFLRREVASESGLLLHLAVHWLNHYPLQLHSPPSLSSHAVRSDVSGDRHKRRRRDKPN